ncbi:CHRD domain-containing protein [Ktedonosporobacter rubrisoli]|uniref:CHRD domain-containing protein n=1 Tax=Ktedonosporobacter rubrisoli TaxID=2509675 RepID=A0A4P6JT27_KTERU|nr:CHRD domain-containing protein [Ktedonosporobacter rubrisoli]QBD78455.1 CHRD domain-containing protein [Ktedonosporobacter rubrisoli]
MIVKFLVRRGILPVLMLIIAGALFIAACSPIGTASTSKKTTSLSSTVINANAVLKHTPVGTADLAWEPGAHALTVKIGLTGLAPKSSYPAYIYAGSCKAPGKLMYTLSVITADDAGAATSTSTVKDVAGGIPADGWHLLVDSAQSASGDKAMPIACGNVSNPNPSATVAHKVQIILANTSAPDQSASGVAQLVLTNGKLTVSLSMSGLAPASSHGADIHLGTCDSQGKVLYTLKELKADSAGKASSTTTLNDVHTLPANGWYISVHSAVQATAQAAADPVACGDVIVSHS